MVKAVWLAAFISIGAAACDGGNSCSSGRLGAVAADAHLAGANYVAVTADAGANYGVVQASNLAAIWRAISDGTSLELLAPAAGGVILVNGGAAARRIDAAGALLWTVGYGDIVGVRAALTDGALPDRDRLAVADAHAARLYGSDGGPVWERALPESTLTVSQVVADREGGVWLVGTFAGSFSPWVAASTAMTIEPSGPFVLHLDGSGSEIGGGAWDTPPVTFNQAVEGIDAGGLPTLVVAGATNYGAAPAFGVTAAQGNALFAAGFGETGQILWSHPLDTTTALQADPDGNLFALTQTSGTLAVDRWDASGTVVAGSSFVVDPTKNVGLDWVSAPVPGGIVVAGELVEPQGPDGDMFCLGRHFLLQVSAATLEIQSLPSRLP